MTDVLSCTGLPDEYHSVTKHILQFLPSRTTLSIPWLAVGVVLWLGSPALQAQEVIELLSRDTQIEPEFQEVYRVGVI